jgi:hypothetical protein
MKAQRSIENLYLRRLPIENRPECRRRLADARKDWDKWRHIIEEIILFHGKERIENLNT